jgi:DNA polymerase-1
MTRFLIIDGNSIGFRAVSAKSPFQEELVNSAGVVTGGVYRFINIFNKACEMVRPTHIIVGYDTSSHTFRNEIDPEYKANRNYADPTKIAERNEMYEQFDLMKKFLEAIGVKHDNIYKFEGDDVVGSYKEISKADRTFILSGDKDTFQLIDGSTRVIFPIKGINEVQIYDEKSFKDRFGIEVEQFIDYKSLFGDSGDNVKGVAGCGEKTAAKLLNKFGSVENILANLDTENKDIRGWKSLSKKISDWDYEKTKSLVTIRRDAPIKYSYDDCAVKLNWENAIELFVDFEFYSFIKRVKERKFYQ